MTGPGDEILAAKAAGGDNGAFQELVVRHRAAVYRLAFSVTGNHADADDAAQEAFLRFYRSLASYDPARPLLPWLMRIALNTSRDLRRSGRRPTRAGTGGELPEIPDPAPDPENRLGASEQGRLLKKALDGLSPDLQATLVLRVIEGMSYRDIAKATGARMGTVMSRLARAREKILKMMMEVPGGGM